MATITRYCDVDADAGGDGTTNALTGASCAYKSLSIWEAAQQQDLTDGGGDIAECICESSDADHTADTTGVAVDGWTTAAANYIYIHTSSGARHDGKWNASKYRLVTDARCIQNFESDLRVIGLQLECNYSGASNRNGIENDSAQLRVEYAYNIVRWTGTTVGTASGIYTTSTSSGKIHNNIVYDWKTEQIRGSGADHAMLVYNNTVIGGAGAIGIYTNYHGAAWINNLAFGSATPYSGTPFAASFNAYDSGADPGTDGQNLSGHAGTDIFVDYNADDFHLKATAPHCIDQGSDLGADYVNDIDGVARTGTWDIGADEYVAAGGNTGTATLTMPKMALTASGSREQTGTGGLTLPKMAIASSGSLVVSGTGDLTFPKTAIAVIGEHADYFGTGGLSFNPNKVLNGFTYSEDLNNAIYTKNATEVDEDDLEVAWAAGGYSDRIHEDGEEDWHYIEKAFTTGTDSANQGFSFHTKQDDYTHIQVWVKNRAGTVVSSNLVDLSDGTSENAFGGTVTVEASGDDGYRIKGTFNMGSGAVTPVLRVYLCPSGTWQSYEGDGESGVYLGGFCHHVDTSLVGLYYATTERTFSSPLCGEGSVVGVGVTGTGGLTQPDIVLSASGALVVTGTGDLSQPKLSLSSSGTLIITGTGGVSLPKVAIGASGTEVLAGTGGLLMPDISLSSSGVLTITGTGDLTIKYALAASGAEILTGSGGLSLKKAAVMAVGSHAEAGAVDGTGSITVPDFSIATTGMAHPAGQGNVGWDFSLSGSGTLVITGAGGLAMSDMAISGVGIHSSVGEPVGTIGMTMPAMSMSGAGGDPQGRHGKLRKRYRMLNPRVVEKIISDQQLNEWVA